MPPLRSEEDQLSQADINEIFRKAHTAAEPPDDAGTSTLLRRPGAVAREVAAWQAQQAEAATRPVPDRGDDTERRDLVARDRRLTERR